MDKILEKKNIYGEFGYGREVEPNISYRLHVYLPELDAHFYNSFKNNYVKEYDNDHYVQAWVDVYKGSDTSIVLQVGKEQIYFQKKDHEHCRENYNGRNRGEFEYPNENIEDLIYAVAAYAYAYKNINKIGQKYSREELETMSYEQLKTVGADLSKVRDGVLYSFKKEFENSLRDGVDKEKLQKLLDEKFKDNSINLEEFVVRNLDKVLQAKTEAETKRREEQQKIDEKNAARQARIDKMKGGLMKVTTPVRLIIGAIKGKIEQSKETKEQRRQDKLAQDRLEQERQQRENLIESILE